MININKTNKSSVESPTEPGNPFKSSAVTVRTPEQNTEEVSVSLDRGVNAFSKLGELITALMEFVKAKNNVHHSIKEQVRRIRVTYNEASDEIRGENVSSPKKMEQATQTTPKPIGVTNKRSRGQNEEPPRITPKRRRKQPPNPDAEKSEATKSQQNLEYDTPIIPEWTKVVRKKTIQKSRSKPNALIIAANGEVTYADILRKIKADPNLKDLGKSVNKIRRTQKGELLLEIKTTNKEETGKFNELIEKTLEGKADVRAKISEKLVEIKDLDEITTAYDICGTLEEQLDISGLQESIVKSIRKAYGGTQIAKICLPDVAANRILNMGKIRIGWSICRVREPISLKRCFRCLEFGHFAGACKSSIDRSNLCRKCGEPNHIAKSCTADPKCMFCVANKCTEIGHIAGSRKCPVFQKAVSLKIQ